MMLTALFGAVVVAALPVQVESVGCPTGHEVEQALAPMVSSVSEAIRPDVARVLRWGNQLQIELVGPDAVVIAERWINDSGSCAELADLIAVVIASWESDVHPEFARPHAEPVAIAVAERSAARTSPSGARVAATYELAAGASLSWSGSPAAAAILAAGWVPRGAGPGLHLSATVESTRTMDLVPGQAAWQRWTGSAELDWRVLRGAWALDLHGGLALGWLAASGIGFSKNHSDTSFAPGGAAGVRFSRRATRRVSVWLELAASYWPRKQVVYGQPNVAPQEVPHYQGLASVGLAFGQSSAER